MPVTEVQGERLIKAIAHTGQQIQSALGYTLSFTEEQLAAASERLGIPDVAGKLAQIDAAMQLQDGLAAILRHLSKRSLASYRPKHLANTASCLRSPVFSGHHLLPEFGQFGFQPTDPLRQLRPAVALR